MEEIKQVGPPENNEPETSSVSRDAPTDYDPYDSPPQEGKQPSVSPWKRSMGTLNQNFPASALIGNTKFYT